MKHAHSDQIDKTDGHILYSHKPLHDTTVDSSGAVLQLFGSGLKHHTYSIARFPELLG